MPVKILLADKSITIQKVVEMLFSGKDYEVSCVSDGETALSEASRIVPDVVLADIDLPRIDGYAFSARLKQVPALAKTPVILMMSRDDVFDDAKARQASVVDYIAKPFESQELIGKVKKSVGAAGPRQAQAAPAPPRPAAAAPSAAVPVSPAVKAKPKQAPPSDIFDIIQDAPTDADLKKPAKPAEEDAIFEVEPVVEVEEPISRDAGQVLPEGEKAVEEMRAGLGIGGEIAPADEEIVSFESLDAAAKSAKEYSPPRSEPRRPVPQINPILEREAREYVPPPPEPEVGDASEEKLRAIAEEIVARVAREHFSRMPAAPAPALPEAKLRRMAEEIIAGTAREHMQNMQPLEAPAVSAEMVQSAVAQSVSRIVREIAREVIEKVAWEVVPDLAAALIKAEIERLKAEP